MTSKRLEALTPKIRAERQAESAISFSDPSKAVQSEKDDADINVIVKRFGLTGKLPTAINLPSYGDFDTISDFRTALDIVSAAESEFLKVPADIRARFDHDPGQFLAFVENPENLDELRKLGLAKPLGVEPPPPADPQE